MALLFIDGINIDPEVQWDIGKFIMSLVTFIFVVNFLTLIYLTVKRLQLWSKRKRAIREMQKARALKQSKKPICK